MNAKTKFSEVLIISDLAKLPAKFVSSISANTPWSSALADSKALVNMGL